MQIDLLKGNVIKSMLLFSVPMILGNLLQQLYNIADTLIVGRFLGAEALAAVGSSFTFMVFLTSVIIGLCMGSGIVFSMYYGAEDIHSLKISLSFSFILIGCLSLCITAAVLAFINPLMHLLQIPAEILTQTHDYMHIIFYGIIFTFLYNYFAAVLRSLGNSLTPLVFLGISSLLNIALDLFFVLTLGLGVAGAAWATVLSQAVSAFGIAAYSFYTQPLLNTKKEDKSNTVGLLSAFRSNFAVCRKVIHFSLLTSIQQSVMNFGILLIQGLVNSFGVSVMAAFAAAVKIDSFAYMPAQDFGNAFSTFIAQNFGAQKKERIQQGIRSGLTMTLGFCLFISIVIWMFAEPLMKIFIDSSEIEILSIGVTYLRIEGAFYFGIGCLFLLYGLYRGIGKPGMSIILTIISLGTRVILAYCLAPTPVGLVGIWWAIPIGWLLADLIGLLYYQRIKKRM